MSEVAQVPQLRFPEFSGEWEDGKLGNYGNLINGLTYSPDNIVDDGLLVLRSSNVQNGQIYLNDNVYVNLDVDDAALTREDDILICVRNGSKRLIGKSTIINKNLPKSTHGAFMTVFRGESNKFISHWFHSSIYYKEVHKNLGATINSINGSDLKKFKTIFPLKPEQQKIAAFLTAVDNKIEQLSKKKALLGEYKKGLMQQIFSQAIRFKADDGSAFPVWEEKKLGDIGHTFNGLTGKTKDDFGRGKPYIQYMQIFESSKINIDNFGLVDVRDDENQKVAQYGDVFFTTSSETPDAVGYSSVLLDDIDKLYLNSFCFGFRPNSLDELSPNFAQFLLRSANFRRRVVRLAQGSTRYNMSKVQLMKEVISLPCLKEQTKIANFLSSIDSKIEQVSKQLDESKQFKKALLQQMFV